MPDGDSISTLIRPVTGMQVARAAQVSRATVSIVMNGQSEARKIKPETVRRVLRVAAELHYAPDQNAVSLHRRQTGVVGLVLLNLKMDWVHLLMRGSRRSSIKVGTPLSWRPTITTPNGIPAN